MLFGKKTLVLPSAAEALPGRATPLPLTDRHAVTGNPLRPPFPVGLRQAVFALGCFWGAERLFWLLPGVWSTAAGYTGGHTPNPTYEEVCSGRTGHAEAVLVVFDHAVVSYQQLLHTFWEAHDPTQGMRQGNDVGTQYRSAIYWLDEAQHAAAERSAQVYGERLRQAGRGPITTELAAAGEFYYAEESHQQYLAKNPGGYCGLHGCGVAYEANT